MLCPLTIKHQTIQCTSQWSICLFTTQNHIYWWWFSQQQPSIFLYHLQPSSYMVFLFTTRTAHLHNLSLHHTNPNIPFKYTTHIQLFLFLFHIASQTGLRTTLMWCLYILIMLFYIYNHLSIRQSYNCIMFKHPWQYPTQCIFPPLNSLTNSYTHYPWVYSLSTVPT